MAAELIERRVKFIPRRRHKVAAGVPFHALCKQLSVKPVQVKSRQGHTDMHAWVLAIEWVVGNDLVQHTGSRDAVTLRTRMRMPSAMVRDWIAYRVA